MDLDIIHGAQDEIPLKQLSSIWHDLYFTFTSADLHVEARMGLD